ncbi:hypothetical protein D3C75_456460 [compost metagenome]
MSFIRYLKSLPSGRPALKVTCLKTTVCDFCWNDIFSHNPLFRNLFIEGVNGVREHYTPIRDCMINNLQIQFFAGIFGQVRFVLLHIGKSHALRRVREAGIVKPAVTVSGNLRSRIRIDNAHIGLIRMLASAQPKGNPARSSQLKGAGTKDSCCSFRIFPAV